MVGSQRLAWLLRSCYPVVLTNATYVIAVHAVPIRFLTGLHIIKLVACTTLQLNNPNSPTNDGHPPDFANPALNQCATCNSSAMCGEDRGRGDHDHNHPTPPPPPPPPYNETEFGKMHGCSLDYNGATPEHPEPPCCQLCCPVNVTEQWYLDHPDDYAYVCSKSSCAPRVGRHNLRDLR